MKKILILLILIPVSCVDRPKKALKDQRPQEVENAVDVVENFDNEIEAPAQKGNVDGAFKKELQKLPLKAVPITENTSFDSFIDEDDYKAINAKVLKLHKIYKNWSNPVQKFRAIVAYRLDLSKDFYTVVVTILQGEYIMETQLINYDLKGTIIASEMVAYDEITEGWTRSKSTITKETITYNYQYPVNEEQQTTSETHVVSIEPNGTLNRLGVDQIFYNLVIKALKLNRKELLPNLQVFKILPNSPNEAVVVIPEIASGSKEEHFLELNTHIAVVNLETKQITHQYFESAQTNGWISDAVQLREIKIDTAPYNVSKNTRAFGIRVYNYGASHANPYENETLSLFVKSNNTLKKILHNYTVIDYGGEWDTNCLGKFIRHNKTLIIAQEKTNEYYDITVKNKVKETNNFEDKNGDCDSKDVVTHLTSVLKFDGELYKELKTSQ